MTVLPDDAEPPSTWPAVLALPTLVLGLAACGAAYAAVAVLLARAVLAAVGP